MLVVTVVAAYAGGCILPSDLDRAGARFLGRMSSFPAWSPDGRSIFFTDRKGGGITQITIHALDVASGRTRDLATVTGLNSGEQLRTTAADPSVVYASIAHADWSLQMNIYRLSAAGGPPEIVANNAGRQWFVISSGGNRIAYQGSRFDSDTIYAVATSSPGAPESVAIPSTGSRPVAMSLSPLGEQVLYRSTSGIYVTPVSGGAHSLVWQSSSDQPDAVAPQVLWQGEVPHLLVATEDGANGAAISIHDVDGLTGERTLVGMIPKLLDESSRWQLARSRDGQSFAAWVPVAVENKTVERTTYRYRLYVHTPRDDQPRPVLEWKSDQPLTWFEFSPDGSRIALLLSGSLHVVDVNGGEAGS